MDLVKALGLLLVVGVVVWLVMLREALTELAAEYEATVQNLEQRIRELERDQRRPDGLQAESVINNLKRRNKWLSDSIVRMVATQPEDESAPQNQETSND